MKKRRNKIIALLLASAMLTANIGIVSAFAAEEEKTEQGAQKDESEEKAEAEAGEKKEDGEKKIQTAAPTADVKEGTYAAAQKITLKSAAKDAVIYYTTDGKEPTEKSTRFDAKKPVQIEKTTTIKAIAVAKDTGKSKVVSFTYKIDENAKNADDKETPTAETAAPTETPEQTPSASPAADPTMIPEQAQTQSEQGEAQLLPAYETEEKAGETSGAETTAIASGKMEQELEKENKISVGTSLETLNQTDGVKVTEGDFTVESIKWEAADSSTAIAAGGKYKITLGVKAKKGFHFDSKTVFTFNGMSGKLVTPTTENDLERTYEFEAAAPAEKPNITPSAGVLGGFKDGETQVELSYNATDRDQAELQYCLGDAPWETYDPAKKITLLENEKGECIVNARVVLNGIASEKATETYTVKVARPTADPDSKTSNETLHVTLSTSTSKYDSQAKIYYTLDGSDPDDKDILYNDPIEVKETTTIKAIAYDKDGNTSTVVTFKYVIKKETPPEPEIEKVSKIAISNLDRPQRGKKPDESASISPKEQVSIKTIEWVKCDVVNGKGSLTDEKVEGVFAAGTYYVAIIRLQPKSDYKFDTELLKDKSNLKIDSYDSQKLSIESVSEDEMIIYTPAVRTELAVTASPTNNTITGLSASYTQGATVTFTMNGAGANNAKEEGNERYVPVKYKISSSEFKFEDNQNPTLAKSFRISTAGTYTLTVTFQKQVYDAESGKWKNVDGATDTKTATVKINASSTTNRTTTTTTKTASSTSSSSDSSTSSKSKNAKTGDETPVGAVATVFVLAGAAVVALVARKRKSQK